MNFFHMCLAELAPLGSPPLDTSFLSNAVMHGHQALSLPQTHEFIQSMVTAMQAYKPFAAQTQEGFFMLHHMMSPAPNTSSYPRLLVCLQLAYTLMPQIHSWEEATFLVKACRECLGTEDHIPIPSFMRWWLMVLCRVIMVCCVNQSVKPSLPEVGNGILPVPQMDVFGQDSAAPRPAQGTGRCTRQWKP